MANTILMLLAMSGIIIGIGTVAYVMVVAVWPLVIVGLAYMLYVVLDYFRKGK